jgi:hypothetical protein
MQLWPFSFRAAAVSGALMGALAGSAPAAAADELGYRGTVGTARIGLTLVLPPANRDGALSGHYFYARFMKDIPLTGSLKAGKLTLSEPGGGAFTLTFVADGAGTAKAATGKPLNFRNSTGLEGTWTGNGKNLAVALVLASGAHEASASSTPAAKASVAPQVTVGERRYSQVTTESDLAFEARVQGFRNAVITGDRAGATRYVQFPLRVNANGKSTTIASAIQLGSAWERIATPAFVEAMKKATPHDLFVSNGMATMGDGIAWFGPKGAVAVNLP